MKRLLLVLLMLFVGIPALAQSYINVTAPSCITDASGTLMPSGTWTIRATDASNNPMPFRTGANTQATTTPVVRTITAGSLVGTLQLANPLTSNPLYVRYFITIQDNTTKKITTYQQVNVVVNDSGNFNFCFMDTGLTLPPPTVLGGVGPAGPAGTASVSSGLTINKISPPANPGSTDLKLFADNTKGIAAFIDSLGANAAPTGRIIDKGFVNVVTDCGSPTDRTTDSCSAWTSCIANNPGATIGVPPLAPVIYGSGTVANTDYTFGDCQLELRGNGQKLISLRGNAAWAGAAIKLKHPTVLSSENFIHVASDCSGCEVHGFETFGQDDWSQGDIKQWRDWTVANLTTAPPVGCPDELAVSGGKAIITDMWLEGGCRHGAYVNGGGALGNKATTSIVVASNSWTVTTSVPHLMRVNMVAVPAGQSDATLNGLGCTITSVTSSTVFVCLKFHADTTSTGGSVAPGAQPDQFKFVNVNADANLGYGMLSQGCDANAGIVVYSDIRGNLVGGARDGSCLKDTWIGISTTANTRSAIAAGTNKTIVASTGLSVTSNILTITTTTSHGWTCNGTDPGCTWITTTGSTDTTFNGTCKLLTVTSTTATCNFTHANGSTGGGTAATSSSDQVYTYYVAKGIKPGAVSGTGYWFGTYIEALNQLYGDRTENSALVLGTNGTLSLNPTKASPSINVANGTLSLIGGVGFSYDGSQDAQVNIDVKCGLTAENICRWRFFDRSGVNRFCLTKDASNNFSLQNNCNAGDSNFIFDNAAGTITSYPKSGASSVFMRSIGQGSGLKHARVSTGSIALSSSAAITLTWPVGSLNFADNSYTVSCNVLEATTSASTLRVHHIESQTATTVVVRVVNDDSGSAHTGTLNCSAMHD